MDDAAAEIEARLRVRRLHDEILHELHETDLVETSCPGCGLRLAYPDYFTVGCCGYCGEIWDLQPL